MTDVLFRLRDLRGSQWRLSAALIITTLILILSHYNPLFATKEISHFIYYLCIPLLLIIVFFKEKPSQYGFQLGNWKLGTIITLIGWIFVILIIYFVSQTNEFKMYYSTQLKPILPLSFLTGLDLIGWEFMFRGLLLFALLPVCGPSAILIQAIPFTLAHIGKPELETLSCIFGGSLFGLIAWKTRSFLYPFLIHWFLTFTTIVFAAAANS